MNDSPEAIRQEMDETKAHLTEKVEILEQQVVDTVQSAGSAVTATVEAVQETVQNVTGTVNSAVQSVAHAMDINEQFNRNPWWILGGAFLAGYVTHEFLASGSRPFPGNYSSDGRQITRRDDSAGQLVSSSSRRSVWNDLVQSTLDSVVTSAKQLINEGAPQIVEYLLSELNPKHQSAQETNFNTTRETNEPRGYTRGSDFERYVSPTERVRSGNTF